MKPNVDRMLTALLRSIGMALYYLGLARLVIWSTRRAPKVLLYHACAPTEDHFIRGLRSNTTPEAFAAQLAFLKRHYTVVGLRELESDTVPNRAVVITFDDGYQSVYEHAIPMLRAYEFPATIYLVTDVVDNDALIWVNELLWFLNRHPEESVRLVQRRFGAPEHETAPALIERVRAAYDKRRVEALLQELRTATGEEASTLARRANLYLSWENVRGMVAAGITFGNHTATHPNLARLDAASQEQELLRARSAIAAHLGSCTSVAYPFGNTDRTARDAALRLGHRSIMLVGGVNAPLDLACVARVPVYATTDAQFFAELEVVAPMRALSRRLWRRLRGRDVVHSSVEA